MRNGLDKCTQLGSQFPGQFGNHTVVNGSKGGKKGKKETHPYLRAGFEFKCCKNKSCRS